MVLALALGLAGGFVKGMAQKKRDLQEQENFEKQLDLQRDRIRNQRLNTAASLQGDMLQSLDKERSQLVSDFQGTVIKTPESTASFQSRLEELQGRRQQLMEQFNTFNDELMGIGSMEGAPGAPSQPSGRQPISLGEPASPARQPSPQPAPASTDVGPKQQPEASAGDSAGAAEGVAVSPEAEQFAATSQRATELVQGLIGGGNVNHPQIGAAEARDRVDEFAKRLENSTDPNEQMIALQMRQVAAGFTDPEDIVKDTNAQNEQFVANQTSFDIKLEGGLDRRFTQQFVGTDEDIAEDLAIVRKVRTVDGDIELESDVDPKEISARVYEFEDPDALRDPEILRKYLEGVVSAKTEGLDGATIPPDIAQSMIPLLQPHIANALADVPVIDGQLQLNPFDESQGELFQIAALAGELNKSAPASVTQIQADLPPLSPENLLNFFDQEVGKIFSVKGALKGGVNNAQRNAVIEEKTQQLNAFITAMAPTKLNSDGSTEFDQLFKAQFRGMVNRVPVTMLNNDEFQSVVRRVLGSQELAKEISNRKKKAKLRDASNLGVPGSAANMTADEFANTELGKFLNLPR